MEYKLELANTSLNIRFTLRSLKIFEEITGKSALDLGANDKLDVSDIIALAYAGVKGADKNVEIDIDDLADELDFPKFNDIMKKFQHDMSIIMGAAEKK